MNREEMTIDEAIAIIRKEYLCVDRDCDIERSCGKCDLMMPSKEPILEAYKMAVKALEQEPCEDAVSRQYLIDIATEDGAYDYVSAQEIANAPSVNPQPKTGHWIEKDGFDGDVYYDCSECGESWTTIEGTPWDNEFKYCPSCGARMVEPQERSDKE